MDPAWGVTVVLASTHTGCSGEPLPKTFPALNKRALKEQRHSQSSQHQRQGAQTLAFYVGPKVPHARVPGMRVSPGVRDLVRRALDSP